MRRMILLCLVTLALGSLVGISSLAHAQSGRGYDLTWGTLDGGGYTFRAAGGYQLGGTIGQPDAGAASGGPYTLTSGFWVGAETLHRVYLPLVVR